MKKAVIFDMDGLMLDSKPTWVKAEKKLLKEFGKEYDLKITKKYHGLRVAGMIKVMRREYNLPLEQKEGEKKLTNFANKNINSPSSALLPGCKKLVKSLSASQKYLLAIASSSPVMLIKTMVEKFAFKDDFDLLVSGEEVKNGKPAPDVFLKCAHLFKIPSDSCLVLEDSPNGVKAAKAAGMKVIAVYNKQFNKPEDFKGMPDKIVDSLKKLDLKIIAKVLASN